MSPVRDDEPVEPVRPRVVATAKRDGVRRHLLDLIEQAGPGTALPPERDLALRLGVSRPTVRAAIEDLTRIGLLVRQQGRGTFTSPRKITQELADGGAAAFGVPPAGAPRATRLKVSPAEPVLRDVRLRPVDAEPMAIERIDLLAHVPPAWRRATWRAATSTGSCASGTGWSSATRCRASSRP